MMKFILSLLLIASQINSYSQNGVTMQSGVPTHCDGAGNCISLGNKFLQVQALTSSPADGATTYFGNLPKAPTGTANISKVYVRNACKIVAAEIYCYSGTAGTNENWSLYIRVNNTTDHLIATVGANTSERVFSKTNFDISLSANDYFEIKMVNPSWATNPLTTIFGGYIKLN